MAKAPATDTEPEADAGTKADAVEVQEAELPEAAEGAAGTGAGQIDLLLETTVPITVHLGQAEMTVGELLKVGPGSVILLDKQAGQPVDLFLRGARFATGHLVVVGEQLGVRIKEVLSSGDGRTGQGAPE